MQLFSLLFLGLVVLGISSDGLGKEQTPDRNEKELRKLLQKQAGKTKVEVIRPDGVITQGYMDLTQKTDDGEEPIIALLRRLRRTKTASNKETRRSFYWDRSPSYAQTVKRVGIQKRIGIQKRHLERLVELLKRLSNDDTHYENYEEKRIGIQRRTPTTGTRTMDVLYRLPFAKLRQAGRRKREADTKKRYASGRYTIEALNKYPLAELYSAGKRSEEENIPDEDDVWENIPEGLAFDPSYNEEVEKFDSLFPTINEADERKEKETARASSHSDATTVAAEEKNEHKADE